ncbi:calcium ATPase [Ramicandelaber brevisporus]|nr:calcium ATPase [Ramicandelaber brevisporus]
MGSSYRDHGWLDQPAEPLLPHSSSSSNGSGASAASPRLRSSNRPITPPPLPHPRLSTQLPASSSNAELIVQYRILAESNYSHGAGDPIALASVPSPGIASPLDNIAAGQPKPSHASLPLPTTNGATKPPSVTVDSTTTIAKGGMSNAHLLSIADLERRMAVNISSGLSSSTAQLRLQRDGPNVLPVPPTRIIPKALGYLFGGFGVIMWVAAIACILAWRPLSPEPDTSDALMNLYLGIVLIASIIVQAAFNAYHDYNSWRVLRSIKSMISSTALVRRNDGQTLIVPAEQLVIGDVVLLEAGMRVPADVRIIESVDLKLNRSMLSGEAEPFEATVDATDESFLSSRNIAPTGTTVLNGRGAGVAVAIGSHTATASIAATTANEQPPPTTLQREISRFVGIIAAMAVATTTFVLILWAVWLRVKYPGFLSLPSALVNAISVLVAFVPCGMPLAVTMTLTIVARMMLDKRILVRSLNAVETLGSVSVICAEKSGTLTLGTMHVDAVFAGNRVVETYDVQASSYGVKSQTNPTGSPLSTEDSSSRSTPEPSQFTTVKETAGEIVRTMQVAGYLCSAAELLDDVNTGVFSDDGDNVISSVLSGDPTDVAIMRFALADGLGAVGAVQNAERVEHVPFTERTKCMITVHRMDDSINDKDSSLLLHVKGAPELILSRCSTVLDADGINERELTVDDTAEFERVQHQWAARGMRVIAIARKTIDDTTPASSNYVAQSTSGLCALGMYAIVDPPRDGIDEMIQICRDAGVRVLMVTGDHYVTAAAVARRVGILTKENLDTIDDIRNHAQSGDTVLVRTVNGNVFDRGLLLTGQDLQQQQLTPEEWTTITKYPEIVFSRITPAQKAEIVTMLRRNGCVVAVTGDAMNDAPALKAADVGVAIGTSSEIAIEASQVVLLDGDLSVIVDAIKYGRLVFDNLQKVILYLLPAGSFSELIPILLSFLLGCPMTLSPFYMVVICVLTDLLSSTALMYEHPEADVLSRRPRNPRTTKLAGARLISHAYFFTGVIESTFANAMFFCYMYYSHGISPSQIFFAYDKWNPDWSPHVRVGQSIHFVSLAMLQTFGNLPGVRTRASSLLRHPMNWVTWAAALATVTVVLFILYAPFVQTAFETRPIPMAYWFFPIAMAVVLVVVEEVRKAYKRRNPKSLLARISW